MKLPLMLTAALALTGCAEFAPAFNPPSALAEGAFQALEIVDYSQATDIARRPDCLHEDGLAEPFIGREPTQAKVSTYFALSMTGHYLVSNWLAREADATGAEGWYALLGMWQVGSIGLEAVTVANNFKLGAKPFGTGLNRLCADHGKGF